MFQCRFHVCTFCSCMCSMIRVVGTVIAFHIGFMVPFSPSDWCLVVQFCLLLHEHLHSSLFPYQPFGQYSLLDIASQLKVPDVWPPDTLALVEVKAGDLLLLLLGINRDNRPWKRCRIEAVRRCRNEAVLVCLRPTIALSSSPLDIHALAIAWRQDNFPLLVFLAFLTFGAM